MDDRALMLAGRSPSLLSESSTFFVFRSGLLADSTGFKRPCRDSSNQVRHATFSIQANMRYGEMGFLTAQMRGIGEMQPADLRLNAACRRVATQLRWRQDAGAADAPAQVGRAVRAALGDASETGAWTGPPGGSRTDPGFRAAVR